MRLIKDLIIVVARILIFIGDVTITIFKFAINLPKNIFNLLPNSLNKLWQFFEKQKTTEKEHLIYKKPKNYFPSLKLPSIRLLNLRAKTRKRGRPRLPAKISFGTKFRYIFIGAFVSFIFIFIPLCTVLFIQSLPNPKELTLSEVAQTTKIYDRNHVLLYQIYANQNRTSVPLSQIPNNLKNATIAIEDKSFYKNPGVDVGAIIRSAIGNISGKPLQGGSTITQQLIKSKLLSPEQSISRKVKEIILSVWAERIYSKNQILEMYFNQVPYGGTAWGAEAAAQTYFGKDIKDLDLAQCAFLAGLPQAPTTYSPYGNYPNLWKERQKEVLSKMVELGYITENQKKNAEKEKITFKPPEEILHAPHFVMYVKDLLVNKYGLAMVEKGGLSVTTSLDLKTQDFVQEAVTNEVENSGYLNFTNGGALITNPKNGDVLAMVGGKNYYDQNGGNYNVTTALRQPGSTIKVVTYSAALMNGYTAATIIMDTPVTYKLIGSSPYSPVNYDGKFHGPISLRNALGNSINVAAVKTLNQVGISKMVDLAKGMGISTWGDSNNYGLAITLGAAEVKMTDMATVYGTLANRGERVDLDPILKVTNYDGTILEEKQNVNKARVLPSEVAYIISNILADNNARSLEFGTNSPLSISGHVVSVKTGTTDSKRDNWTIGYTPNLLAAVWVGNNDNSPMNPILASGITGAAPIWNKIMTKLLQGENRNDEIYQVPANIVIRTCNGRVEYFVRGTENQSACRSLSINDQPPTIASN